MKLDLVEFEMKYLRGRIKVNLANRDMPKVFFNLRQLFIRIKKLYPSYCAWVTIVKLRKRKGGYILVEEIAKHLGEFS